jgi:hypothetical protein
MTFLAIAVNEPLTAAEGIDEEAPQEAADSRAPETNHDAEEQPLLGFHDLPTIQPARAPMMM